MLPEAFKRLKPLVGNRIDELWIAYQLGDAKEKQAIDELLTVLAVKRLGVAVGDEKITLDPPKPSVIGGGTFTLGSVVYPGLAPYPFTLYRQELLRHVFVLGPSGTGKTTLLLGLFRQLLRDRIPFAAIDFKRNYRCLLRDAHASHLVVFTIGRTTAPLRLNMLAPPSGVRMEEWVEALTDTIAAAYLLMQGARNVLKEALLSAITARKDHATLRDALGVLTQQLATARSGSRRYGWLESSYRSIEELSKGPLGEALNDAHGVSIAALLDLPVVFELQGLGDDQKRCLCIYLLQAVLLVRKHQAAPREIVRHVLVFDEAHNVFPKDQWGQLTVASRLAREVREYGEAIIAATQQTDVSDSLLANSGIKVILRTDHPKDADFASKLLQVDVRWLAKIPLGQGIARLPTRYYQPFLFSFPEQPMKNMLASDDLVRERYTQWSGPPAFDEIAAVLAPLNALASRTLGGLVPLGVVHALDEAIGLAPRSAATPSGGRAEQLLLDIASFPITTVTERYARLGWNPKTGNAVKDDAVRRGLASFEIIPAGRTRVTLLTLTAEGEAVVRKHGGDVRHSGRAGLEHEFWRSRIKERCEKRGYAVVEEYRLASGKRVDLRAVRGDGSFFIEVETGSSTVAENIAKCAGLGRLVVFFTSTEALRAARGIVPADVTALAPETLDELHRMLLGGS